MSPLPAPSKSYLIKADVLDSDCSTSSSGDVNNTPSELLIEQQRSSSSYDDNESADGESVDDDDDNDDDDDDDGESVEDLPDCTTTTPQSQSSSQGKKKKKNKKKKGKKKKKKNKRKNNQPHHQQQQQPKGQEQAQTVVKAAAAINTNKKVQFGSVKIIEFARCLGTSVVPGDGGWPLGSEMSPLAQQTTCNENDDDNNNNDSRSNNKKGQTCTSSSSSSSSCSVNDYEAKKLARLQERWKSIVVNTNDNDLEQQQQDELLLLPPPTELETRQWDYKKGKAKNPLFGMLTEKERMKILLVDSGSTTTVYAASTIPSGTSSSASSSWTSNSNSNNNSTKPPSPSRTKSSSSSDQRQNVQHPKRSRSGSFGSSSSNSNTNKSSNTGGGGGGARAVTRSRSGSVGNSSSSVVNSANSGGNIGGEQYNDTYTEFQVHHVRNELEQLRVERSKIAGCACRKLSVYIPPPNCGLGKKAQHRRMNLPRVKEELKKRHALPTSMQSREELELLLHDLVQQEPCCGNDCFCVRNGIDCQADACSCWYTSHQQKTGGGSGSGGRTSSSSSGSSSKGQQEMNEPLSVAAIQERCGNTYGMYTVDVDAINDFRKNYYGAPVMDNTNSESSGVFLCLPTRQE